MFIFGKNKEDLCSRIVTFGNNEDSTAEVPQKFTYTLEPFTYTLEPFTYTLQTVKLLGYLCNRILIIAKSNNSTAEVLLILTKNKYSTAEAPQQYVCAAPGLMPSGGSDWSDNR